MQILRNPISALKCTRIAEIFAFLGGNRGQGTRQWRQILDWKWKLRPFRACAMKNVQYNPYLWPIAEISASFRKSGSRNTIRCPWRKPARGCTILFSGCVAHTLWSPMKLLLFHPTIIRTARSLCCPIAIAYGQIINWCRHVCSLSYEWQFSVLCVLCKCFVSCPFETARMDKLTVNWLLNALLLFTCYQGMTHAPILFSKKLIISNVSHRHLCQWLKLSRKRYDVDEISYFCYLATTKGQLTTCKVCLFAVL